MSIPIQPQLEFLDGLTKFNGIEISIALNKMDLPNAKVHFEESKKNVEKFFIEKKAKIKSIFSTVAIQKPRYVEENKNAVKVILDLIDYTDEDPFLEWNLD
jgi:hypothetical protein